jgi:hypothetical protein
LFDSGNNCHTWGWKIMIGDVRMMVGMLFYVKQILDESQVVVKLSLGSKMMFIVNNEIEKLLEVERKVFHLMTSKFTTFGKVCASRYTDILFRNPSRSFS